MTTDFAHLNPAAALTGAEIVPLQQATVTLRSDINTIIAAAIGFALGLFVPASGDTSGVTDVGNAANAYTKAVNSIVSYQSANWANAGFRLGPGTHYWNVTNALMVASPPSNNTYGINIQGAGGRNTTRIDYNPSVSGPMFTNAFWLGCNFSDITFWGHDAASSFFAATEGTAPNGNIQDTTFERCKWSGNWNHIFSLTGTNNNSEWKITNCSVNATLAGSWLFSPAVGAGGSDQFLNFWFTNCQFNAPSGSWVNLGSGGHVKIINCDESGWLPTTPTYLFNFPGTAHAHGVCSFKLELRMQMGNANCLLINCAWNQGNVHFNLLDQSPALDSGYPATNLVAVFNYNQTAGPDIMFSNCQLAGMHSYLTGTSNCHNQAGAVYDNFTFLQNPDPQSFISWNGVTNGGDGGSNTGGAPRLEFRHSKNLNDSTVVGYRECLDSNHLWQYTASRVIQNRTAKLSGSNNDMPLSLGTGVPTMLPLGSMVKSARFTTPSTISGSWGYKLQTMEAVPTVLATFTGTGGISDATVPLSPPLICDSTLKRQLVWVETANRGTNFVGSYPMVEYIG